MNSCEVVIEPPNPSDLFAPTSKEVDSENHFYIENKIGQTLDVSFIANDYCTDNGEAVEIALHKGYHVTRILSKVNVYRFIIRDNGICKFECDKWKNFKLVVTNDSGNALILSQKPNCKTVITKN
jgi:hypothetical protein